MGPASGHLHSQHEGGAGGQIPADKVRGRLEGEGNDGHFQIGESAGKYKKVGRQKVYVIGIWVSAFPSRHPHACRWGGSVLDSVIGTFLTQNASDVLSSRAFLSLVARFPSERYRQGLAVLSGRRDGPRAGATAETAVIDLTGAAPASDPDLPGWSAGHLAIGLPLKPPLACTLQAKA